MSVLLEASSAVVNQVVPPADYIKFLTEELARHRGFLDDTITKLGVFLAVMLTAIGATGTFMGWKSLKEIRESTKEIFERDAKKILNDKVAELNAKLEEVSQSHASAQKNISELEQAYKSRLGSIQDWLIKLQTDAAPSATVPQEGKPRLSVLWVDDRPQNNTMLMDTFIDHGIKVRTALSTKRAADLVSRNSYDILISDMGRSDATDAGVQLLQLLRSLPADKQPLERIIYASRSAIREFGDRAKQAGATLVTSNPGELLERVLQKAQQRALVE
jgi:CheY-like chemotaxis protein